MSNRNADRIEPAAYWRLAFIFDAPRGNRDALRGALQASAGAIHAAAKGAGVRIGIAEHFLETTGTASDDFSSWRTNDGAVEITVSQEQAKELPSIATLMRPVLEPLLDMSSVELTAGPTYFMVPPRVGGTFLSLSFRRDPSITKEEFSSWWYYRHSSIAIPLLGKLLLSYDQVHCEDTMSEAVSKAFGVPVSQYDAYDNLTWASWEAFVESTSSDPTGGQRLAEDEAGHIDNSTRRHGVMATL